MFSNKWAVKNLMASPLHPILFAIAPILLFFSYNKGELSLGDSSFLLSLGVAVLISIALWLMLGWITHDKKRAALLVSLFAILFFSYGHVHTLINEFSFKIAGIVIGPDKLLFSIWGFLFLGCSIFILKAKRDWTMPTRFLNFVSALLVITSLASIIPYKIREATVTLPTGSDTDNSAQEPGTANSDELRDVYYFIFDRYANESILKKYAGFDNREFLSFLKEKGFYVASKSAANYPRTHVSLPSSLNMEHLTTLTASIDRNSASNMPLFELIENNRVMRFLKDRGYKYIHLGDEWSGTWRNRYADIDVHYIGSFGGEFTTAFLKTTLYYPIAKKISLGKLDDREIKREKILSKFEKLSEIPEVEGPKFVFAHFLIPHEPFVFGKNGEEVSEKDDKQGSIPAYLNQLIFTNKKVEEVVTQILAKSKITPIVVIQSDEGPFYFTAGAWNKEAENIRAHARILNAYLLPGIKKTGLYQTITPVNSFRIIFNKYFGTNYELLPDETYTIPNDRSSYQYTNVTDKIWSD